MALSAKRVPDPCPNAISFTYLWSLWIRDITTTGSMVPNTQIMLIADKELLG